MKQTKPVTKLTLLGAVVALLLCFAMLLGTTYAWFTDSVTSAGNIIKTGKLDIKFQYYTGSDWADVEGPIFNSAAVAQNSTSTLWEPNKTQYVYLRLVNAGNLALKYQVTIKPLNVGTTAAQIAANTALLPWLEYGIVPDANPTTNQVTPTTNFNFANPGFAFDAVTRVSDENVPLEVGAEHYFALGIHLNKDAGNACQDAQVNFDMTVLATQLESESDSFDNHYDHDADGLPDYPAYQTGSAEVAPNEPTTVSTQIMTVTVPADAGNGTETPITSLHLEVNNTAVTNSGNEIIVTADADLYDQDGNVVSGSVTSPLTVKINVGAANAGKTAKVKHDGEVVATTMVDEEGYITYQAQHFCLVEVTMSDNAFMSSTTNDTYPTLSEAVAATTSGGTVTLLKDVTVGAGDYANSTSSYSKQPAVVNRVNYGITINGNNHSITFTGQTGKTSLIGDMYGTLKNITLKGMNGPVTQDANTGVVFENVTTEGAMAASGNCGAFVTYVWYGTGNQIDFIDCVSDVDMTGSGTSADYNAAFVGYFGYQDYVVNFTRCINKGNVVCGSAGMFIGNVRSYTATINITDCLNNGLIQRTYIPEAQYRHNNMLYGTTSDYNATTYIDGVMYTMAQVNNHEADEMIGGTGRYVLGPADNTLALTRNDDGTFTVTPSSIEGVSYYVVNIGLYCSLNAGGSGRFYVTETLTGLNLKTTMVEYAFVDAAWVEAHAGGTAGTVVLGENTFNIYTYDNTTYYVVDAARFNLHGNIHYAELYSVSAYAADGTLLASATLPSGN